MRLIITITAACFFNLVSAQNVGIGVNTPAEQLEVNGNLKTDGLTLYSGGFPFDFLTKITPSGTAGFKKGHGGIGMNYIICINGIFPTSGPANHSAGFVGEIRIVTTDIAPKNWMFCHGQHLKQDSLPYGGLYALIQKTFGGTDSTFALPDLRGRLPIGVGPHPGGYNWTRGEKSH